MLPFKQREGPKEESLLLHIENLNFRKVSYTVDGRYNLKVLPLCATVCGAHSFVM